MSNKLAPVVFGLLALVLVSVATMGQISTPGGGGAITANSTSTSGCTDKSFIWSSSAKTACGGELVVTSASAISTDAAHQFAALNTTDSGGSGVGVGSITTLGGMDIAKQLSVGTNVRATLGFIITSGSVANGLYFQSASQIYSTSNGVITMVDWNAGTTFGRLTFGGTTASYPAVKRNAAALNFRLADDSADAAITSSSIVNSGSMMVGSGTALTLVTGEQGMAKITASGSAPGAAGAKFEVVCGTGAGTAKMIMYAGTSTTPVTIIDNVGAGVTGC